jgi:hypothetical protein
MSEMMTWNLVFLPRLGDPQQIRDEFRAQIAAEDAAVAVEHRRSERCSHQEWQSLRL